MSENYTAKFKQGTKIVLNNEPYIIINSTFVNPGKGQAFVRITLKQLCNGKKIEKTCKNTDSLPIANIKNIIVYYLYKNYKSLFFMEKTNFEEYSIDRKLLKENEKWIIPETEYQATIWNEKLITVIPNNFINLYVVQTSPYYKKKSITSGNKLAKLNTGATIKVPLFIKTGDKIKIDTRSSQYVSRIK
ncbi:elongation factor P [Buchnera aphidicola]|uniref:Elongation factor P n=1 Tax=Buchnera aphidicola (Anoecia oenotherae) TaxID=1241833 RepID=A0A4D6XPG2_9GAMM|nr:elongation factor P [Buchnera aphidicola]QCI19162.1 elongation factor P [Buchnera aphidicola (Anoecia oenotherae)]